MEDDDKDQRSDQDNENQSQDNGGGSGSSSSINKYFGKADKNIKLITSKFKSNFKVPKTQKRINYTIESSAKNSSGIKDIYEKPKIKFEYASQIERLQGKLKARLALYPLDKKNKFSQANINLKCCANKNTQNIFDFKLNNHHELITKIKRIRYYMNRSIKHQVDAEVNVNKVLEAKFNFNFDSLQKIDFQNRYKYIKNAHLKGKFTTKFNKDKFDLTKLQLAAKFFWQTEKLKVKTQNKFILNWSAKGNHQVKGNFQISDKSKFWTFYSSANAYFWGLKHDESKILYSLTQNWKIGAAYNSKGPEFVIQNGKLDRPWINSFGLYSSTKNITMIVKNKLDRNRLGKINYELALQSKLLPNSLNDLTFGITLNINK